MDSLAAPAPVPSLEERERALAAREKAVQAAKERALDLRAHELAVRDVQKILEDYAQDQFLDAQKPERLAVQNQ